MLLLIPIAGMFLLAFGALSWPILAIMGGVILLTTAFAVFYRKGSFLQKLLTTLKHGFIVLWNGFKPLIPAFKIIFYPIILQVRNFIKILKVAYKIVMWIGKHIAHHINQAICSTTKSKFLVLKSFQLVLLVNIHQSIKF